VSLHRQVQKEQVTAVSLEGSHILSFAVVTGFHQLTVQLIDQRASLESIDRFLGLPMGLRYEGLDGRVPGNAAATSVIISTVFIFSFRCFSTTAFSHINASVVFLPGRDPNWYGCHHP
jgi:hypothetical protein